MKLVINKCYGGYGLSDEAYLWLASNFGIPIKKYVDEKFSSETRKYLPEPANAGEVIFDRDLAEDKLNYSSLRRLSGRYWAIDWDEKRDDPRIVACVETLGDKANGTHAKLVVVEIPDGTDWEIDEYDGIETVAEKHKTWG